jgi:hypothetical protein
VIDDDDDDDNNNRDSNFLETSEFFIPDDGCFRPKHVVNQFLILSCDFSQTCVARD